MSADASKEDHVPIVGWVDHTIASAPDESGNVHHISVHTPGVVLVRQDRPAPAKP